MLRTGVDKKDPFFPGQTQFQIVTYGLLWQKLARSGPHVADELFQYNSCFLLDEFSGGVEWGDRI